ncbi:MAG: ACP S-malonyltransferase [Gammaproteobacteria bacterium]
MSLTKALLFPGQGSQSSGMLTQLGLAHPSILQNYKHEIDEFSNLIDIDFLELIENKDLEDNLNQTQYTQPSILFTSYLAYQHLLTEKDNIDYFAGHSLGEYSALVCSGSLQLLDGLSLVFKRGQLMAATEPGAMTAILGIDNNIIDEVCYSVTEEGFMVQSANKNTPLQTVISGTIEGIEKAEAILIERGAKRAIRLNVSVASHSLLMKSIVDDFSKALEEVDIQMPDVPIIQNVTADIPENLESLKMNLVNQLYYPVNWVGTMKKLSTIDQMIECGPGKVLTGLGKQNNVSVCDILNFEG